MRRRRDQPASSLDLFLDTICNTFGGIMFMAILLAVLVQVSGKEESMDTSSQTATMSADEARACLTQLDQLQHQHSSLEEAIAELRRSQPKPEDQAVNEIRQECETEQTKIDKLMAQKMELTKQLAEQVEKNAEIVEEMQQFQEQLIAERAAVEKETAALDEALSDKMEILKLPKIETSFKSKVFLLMRFDKIYGLFQSAESSNMLDDLNDSDFKIVRLGNESFSAAPLASKGWKATSDELSNYISRCSPQSHVFVVIIWPDSYAEFANLKQLIIEKGFRYDLQPVGDIESCPFGQGESSSQVQ